MSDGGKGDGRRNRHISQEEEQLRWELAFKTHNNPKRKEEIKEILKKFKN